MSINSGILAFGQRRLWDVSKGRMGIFHLRVSSLFVIMTGTVRIEWVSFTGTFNWIGVTDLLNVGNYHFKFIFSSILYGLVQRSHTVICI